MVEKGNQNPENRNRNRNDKMKIIKFNFVFIFIDETIIQVFFFLIHKSKILQWTFVFFHVRFDQIWNLNMD